MTYLPRIVDKEVAHALHTAGALYLKGPRACGKTSTARQFAQSIIQLDRDTAEASAARTHPALALNGTKPRLIDEWQAAPGVWNEVRHAVDDSTTTGQFLLTGSATPAEDTLRHSGAGRIRSITMRTLSFFERNIPAERISLSQIAAGKQSPTNGTDATVTDYAQWIVTGGFPGFFTQDPLNAQDNILSYLSEMSEHDYPELGGPRRDPRRFMSFLRAYSGLIAQPATAAALRRRIGELSSATTAPAAETVTILHDFATRLFLVEDQPAWSPQTRSARTMVQMPKRQLADPALAAALLGTGPDKLLQDPETLGILFEAQLVHDLRIYIQALRGRGVFHLRDMKGREEIDAVAEFRDGSWIGFEAKLSHNHIDTAAKHLLKVSATIKLPPTALIVVIPTGPAYQRPDGVWVVPLAALGP